LTKTAIEAQCFPDDVLLRAFQQNQLRLFSIPSEEQRLWDGGEFPDDIEYPVLVFIWLNEEERGTKPDCEPFVPPPVSKTANSPAGWTGVAAAFAIVTLVLKE